jgi:hypothetical protein
LTRNVYRGTGIGIKGVRVLSNTTMRGTTIFKTGKNFRVDFDFRNYLHYHRRGPGGIGRHYKRTASIWCLGTGRQVCRF